MEELEKAMHDIGMLVGSIEKTIEAINAVIMLGDIKTARLNAITIANHSLELYEKLCGISSYSKGSNSPSSADSSSQVSR